MSEVEIEDETLGLRGGVCHLQKEVSSPLVYVDDRVPPSKGPGESMIKKPCRSTTNIRGSGRGQRGRKVSRWCTWDRRFSKE